MRNKDSEVLCENAILACLSMLTQMSLYNVGKAIGFVHINALKHPLGPGRPGTDDDGMIISKA